MKQGLKPAQAIINGEKSSVARASVRVIALLTNWGGQSKTNGGTVKFAVPLFGHATPDAQERVPRPMSIRAM